MELILSFLFVRSLRDVHAQMCHIFNIILLLIFHWIEEILYLIRREMPFFNPLFRNFQYYKCIRHGYILWLSLKFTSSYILVMLMEYQYFFLTRSKYSRINSHHTIKQHNKPILVLRSCITWKIDFTQEKLYNLAS